jgi:hypothetical protein
MHAFCELLFQCFHAARSFRQAAAAIRVKRSLRPPEALSAHAVVPRPSAIVSIFVMRATRVRAN